MNAGPTALPPRYRDPVPIGAGGMGTVFRAVDAQLGRTVAVKVLAEHAAGNQEVRDRFLREARIAARISHPNVAVIHDVGEWNGRPYIVMEHCAGGSLDRRVPAGPVPPGDVLGWIAQAAAGIDAGHAAGVVHRDVKPHNLLLTVDGVLKVSDFGIARVVDGSSSHVTVTGMFLGSVGYAAPEVLLGERASAAADVFALGVVAYELLTGGRPFGGRPTAAEMACTINEPAPPPSTRVAGLPASVDPVFAWVLDRDPTRRPASARLFADALRDAVTAPATIATTRIAPAGAGPGPRRGADAPASDGRTMPLPAPGAAVPPPHVRARRSRRGLAIVAAGGLVAAVAAGGVVAVVAGGDDPGPAGTTAAETAPAAVPVTEVVTVVSTAAPVTVTSSRTVSVPATTAPAPATTAPPPADPDVTAGEEAAAKELTDDAKRALDAGDPTAALALQSRALPTLEALGDPESEGYLANGLYNLGAAHLRLGDCASAVPALQRALDLGGSKRAVRVRRDELRTARRCA